MSIFKLVFPKKIVTTELADCNHVVLILSVMNYEMGWESLSRDLSTCGIGGWKPPSRHRVFFQRSTSLFTFAMLGAPLLVRALRAVSKEKTALASAP